MQPRLDVDTASLARGYDAVCLFVNDRCDKEVLGSDTRAQHGICSLMASVITIETEIPILVISSFLKCQLQFRRRVKPILEYLSKNRSPRVHIRILDTTEKLRMGFAH